jgi:hypothetical protein
MHVPKSAGASILAALEKTLPAGSLAPQRFDSSVFCDFNDFELLRPDVRARVAVNLPEVESLGRYQAVAGHFSLATLLHVARASSIATILREPRARLLSVYTYCRTPGVFDLMSPYRMHEHASRPLPAFLSEPRLAPAIDNQLCRMLLHGDPRLPRTGFIAQAEMAGIAADAIAQLDTLGFVGVLELGHTAWEGVGRLFDATLTPIEVNVAGLNLPMPMPGDDPVPFSCEDLALIEQRSAADAIVFDHALQRAGLSGRQRRQLSDGAFARQLVRFGGLLGRCGARAPEPSEAVELLQAQLHEQEELRAELARHREWLAGIQGSTSWKMTAPLRAAKRRVRELQRGARERHLMW